MHDDEFQRLLDDYLDPPGERSPELGDVRILWVRGNPAYGAQHILDEHAITEEEVEQVLLDVPPHVEARRHPDFPNRTVFWGATRHDRWIFVVCEDWMEGDVRHLRPITAFEPEEGRRYWEGHR